MCDPVPYAPMIVFLRSHHIHRTKRYVVVVVVVVQGSARTRTPSGCVNTGKITTTVTRRQDTPTTCDHTVTRPASMLPEAARSAYRPLSAPTLPYS